MTSDTVLDSLRHALADLSLGDPLEQVQARGTRMRHQRRARRATGLVTALTLGAVTATVLTGNSADRPDSPIVLAAATLPVAPVSLAHVPSGVRRSTDLDGGPLRLLYIDSDNSLVGVAAFTGRPSTEPGTNRDVSILGRPGTLIVQAGEGDEARAQLVWERQPGQWIRMVGQRDDADPNKLLAYARDLVDVPVELDMHLTVAPSGWEVLHYKDLGTGGVVDLRNPQDEDESLVVALQHTRYPGFDPKTLMYRGPVTVHTVQGHPAHLVQAATGWYLEALSGDTWFSVQAPAALSADQVIELAQGVTATKPSARA